jgi:phosphomannomutase
VEDRYTKIFGAYDVRGKVGQDLDSPTAARIAQAYAEYVCPDRAGHFVIGHDARWSSPAIAEAASVGIREAGHRVTQMGLSSTPMVYWYGAEGGFDGSVAISASHLPPEYNGLKLCSRDAVPLSADHGLPDIMQALQKGLKPASRPSSEFVRQVSPLPLYASRLFNHLKPARFMKIAVDAGNGMGGGETEAVFSYSDTVEIWRLGFYYDAKFPLRPSNPLEEGALEQLSRTVRQHHLAFGLAFDGDADRAVVVDEKGEPVPPDALGGLIALRLLKEHPGATILHDLRVSRAFTEVLAAAGARTVRSRVGHAFIKRAMREHGAVFAMELSGHYYYQDLHYTDNALRTLIELVNIASEEDKPLSELGQAFERYPTSGEINIHVRDWQAVLASLERKYGDGQVDHLDGLSVEYPDWWFNIRPSHTEPLVRINVGATSQKALEAKQQMLLTEIGQYQTA